MGALVAALAAFWPGTGEAFVAGSSYGDERRHAAAGPRAPCSPGRWPLAWAVAVAGVAAGPLLLAARQWVAGAAALAAGLPAAGVAVRSMHTLARRWLVFVPNGVVVHDPLALAEPVLLRRAEVRSFGPGAGRHRGAGPDPRCAGPGARGQARSARVAGAGGREDARRERGDDRRSAAGLAHPPRRRFWPRPAAAGWREAGWDAGA